MRTIIVGNGSSLLDNTNGDIINSFDNVVRFNAYTIESFEKHVGTKTTIWFNTINFQNKNDWRVSSPYNQIFLHSWQWDDKKDKLYIDFCSHFRLNNIDTPITKTKKQSIIEIANYFNIETYKAFSTGIIAIWEMLKMSPTVVITGFDWWDRNEHHYNDKACRGTLHKPVIEKQIIDQLIDEKRINIL
jgi:hypothetical protein